MAAETVELHKLKVPVEPLRPQAPPGRDRPRQRGDPGFPPAAPGPGTVLGVPAGAGSAFTSPGSRLPGGAGPPVPGEPPSLGPPGLTGSPGVNPGSPGRLAAFVAPKKEQIAVFIQTLLNGFIHSFRGALSALTGGSLSRSWPS